MWVALRFRLMEELDADSFQAGDVEKLRFGVEFEGVQFLSNAAAAILLEEQHKAKYAASGERPPE